MLIPAHRLAFVLLDRDLVCVSPVHQQDLTVREVLHTRVCDLSLSTYTNTSSSMTDQPDLARIDRILAEKKKNSATPNRSRSRSRDGVDMLKRSISNAGQRIRSLSHSRPSENISANVKTIPPASGPLKRYVSESTGELILTSSAPGPEIIQHNYTFQSSLTCDVKFRERDHSQATAMLDTGSCTSFVTRFSARTRFAPSDFVKVDSELEFGTGAGPMYGSEYVIADIYIPCTLSSGIPALAKTTVMLWVRDVAFGSEVDMLLGMDWIQAQSVSLITPSSTAILGACGNAEFKTRTSQHPGFVTRKVAAPEPSISSRAMGKRPVPRPCDLPRVEMITAPKIPTRTTSRSSISSDDSYEFTICEARAVQIISSGTPRIVEIPGPTTLAARAVPMVRVVPHLVNIPPALSCLASTVVCSPMEPVLTVAVSAPIGRPRTTAVRPRAQIFKDAISFSSSLPQEPIHQPEITAPVLLRPESFSFDAPRTAPCPPNADEEAKKKFQEMERAVEKLLLLGTESKDTGRTCSGRKADGKLRDDNKAVVNDENKAAVQAEGNSVSKEAEKVYSKIEKAVDPHKPLDRALAAKVGAEEEIAKRVSKMI